MSNLEYCEYVEVPYKVDALQFDGDNAADFLKIPMVVGVNIHHEKHDRHSFRVCSMTVTYHTYSYEGPTLLYKEVDVANQSYLVVKGMDWKSMSSYSFEKKFRKIS